MRRGRGWGAWIALACALAIMAPGAGPAVAHPADQAAAEIQVHRSAVTMTLTLPTGLVGFADRDGNGQLSLAEIRAHNTALQAYLSGRIRMIGFPTAAAGPDGRPGRLVVGPAQAPALPTGMKGTPLTHSVLRLTYTWPHPVEGLLVEYGLFAPGVLTQSALATIVRNGRVQSAVFTPEQQQLWVGPGHGAFWTQARSFLVLGIEHILSGYDHILFVLGLLMLGGGLRQLLKVITAFTAAHSLTLSLGVLGLVALPPRLIESAIAASIVYVAAENLWRRGAGISARWAVAFGFGLVHGLGFASILTEMQLPRPVLAVSLASFNVGVEIGQVGVVLLGTGLLFAIRHWRGEPLVRAAVAAGAGAAGALWFVQRAFFGA